MAARKTKRAKASSLEASMSQTARKMVLAASDILLGGVAIGFTLFSWLSPATFHPDDPSWMQAIVSDSGPVSVHNLGGLAGAHLAGLLVGLFGIAGWLVALVPLRAWYLRFRKSRYRMIVIQVVGVVAWISVVSAGCAIAARGNGGVWGVYDPAGGTVGDMLGLQFFWRFFNVGSWIFLTTIFGLLSIFIGGMPVAKNTARVTAVAGRGLQGWMNRQVVNFRRKKRERAFKREQEREQSQIKAAASAGIGAEIDQDVPSYSERDAQASESVAAQPPAQASSTVTASAAAASLDATATNRAATSEQSMPAFLRGAAKDDAPQQTRKTPEFDSLSLTVGQVAGQSEASGADQVAPEFTVIRKAAQEAQKAKTDKKKKQLSMPMASGEKYTLPTVALLDDHDVAGKDSEDQVYKAQAQILENKLKDFGVKGTVEKAHAGPVITVFEFRLAPGTRLSKLTQLEDDLALALSVQSVRISRFPGRDVMGIEIPASDRHIVPMKVVVEDKGFGKKSNKLPFAVGKNVFGDPVSTDISRMPHLLMGGATGSGKSVGINTILISLLFCKTPEELKLFLIDPKMLEMSKYENIPHLGYPVVTDSRRAVAMLRKLVQVMEERYTLMMNAGVRNIGGYNEKVKAGKLDAEMYPYMPYMLCIVDELADLMMVARKDVEEPIARLAQKARAAGIHLVLATQRPSVDVVTGLIKSNFPARISFKVSARVDSKTILDEIGAQNLLGKGDMLFLDPNEGGNISRVHGCFVSDDEVDRVCDFWREQGTSEAMFSDDELAALEEGDDANGADAGPQGGSQYEQAVALAVREQEISISRVQRVLSIGYNKAANFIEQMEREGIVGPPEGAGKRRKVLVQPHELTPRDAEPGQHG